MSSDENNNYELYSSEGTSPLEDPDSTPTYELEGTSMDTLEEYDASEDEEGSGNNSRIFMIALGVLAGVFIISIIGMILLSTFIMPRQSEMKTQTAEAILYGNEATIQVATQTGEAFAHAAELTQIAVNASPTPIEIATNTPVAPTETVMMPTGIATATEEVAATLVGELATEIATTTNEAQQQTLEALQTRVASSPTPTEEGAEDAVATLNPAQLTATAVAAGGSGGAGTDPGEDVLPDTGVLDGVLYTAIAAVLLIGVIIGARKLRKA